MILVRDRDRRDPTDTGRRDGRRAVSLGNYRASVKVAVRPRRVFNGNRALPGADAREHSHQATGVLACLVEGAQTQGVGKAALDADHRAGILVFDPG
jgi:hypothetical protein